MDFLVLLLVKRMLKCTATHGNIALGALTGAFLTCVVVILPIPYAILKFMLFHMFVNTIMIRVGLKIKQIKSFVKAFCLLYIGSFLLGGVLQALHQYVRIGSLFFAAAIGGYFVVSKIWDYIAAIQKINQYQCEVELHFQGKTFLVKAIIDTGNGLRDPFSNQPVNILDQDIAKRLLGEEKLEKIKFIPYHSIGKKSGILPAVKIDQMCIYREDKCVIREPLIGISEEKISAEGEYQMILNPNIF